MSGIKVIKGGVTAAHGFRAAAIFAGIKAANKKREDMALIASEVPATAAGPTGQQPVARGCPGRQSPRSVAGRGGGSGEEAAGASPSCGLPTGDTSSRRNSFRLIAS